MAYSINFYLDKKGQTTSNKDQHQLFMYLRFDGRTIKTYVERKCSLKEWDSKSQRVNSRYYKEGARELNDYFDKLESKTGKVFEANNNQGIVTSKEDVLKVIDECNNRNGVRNAHVSFDEAFAEFIASKAVSFTEPTLKTYRTTLKHLKAFSEKKRVALRFENITLHFEERFRSYLYVNCGMTNNTIAKYVKTLKTFMRFCTEDRSYNSPLNVQYRKFDTTEKDTEVYALSIRELLHLYNFSFENPHYAKVRDVFCFLCFTGLRFSDAENLKRADIRNGNMYILVKKTKQYIVIPLTEYTTAILKKYDHCERPLPIISNQKTNEALHEIGELIGLNELVKTVTYSGTEAIETYVPKFKVLTSHLGRKTFITNSLLLGIPEKVLQAMGAPKHQNVFRKYISFADAHKEKAMANAWTAEKLAEAL